MNKSAEPCIKLLAVDDDPAALELIEESLAREGVEIYTAAGAPEGLELVSRRRPDIVLLDLMMPGVRGMELLDRIMEISPSTDVVLVTGHYSTDSAVEAIRRGASDYITKPISVAGLRKRIGAMIDEAVRQRRTVNLDDELQKTSRFEGMVGRSPLMFEMCRTIRRVAPHFSCVLVTGETGTGKELVARALHNLSPAASKRMVACNCTTIVDSLFESELFGHVRGAFTGADRDKAGMIEYAGGGTLFLDEIGDIPCEAQAKLLRAVETGEYQRVGSPVTHRADVRIIAATNCDLGGLMSAGEFREDLYYRLSMVEIRIPPLRERTEDLPLLEKHFVDRFAAEYGKEIRGITPRAQIALARYSWPGNVRELENAIGRACMMADSAMIDIGDLPEKLRAAPAARELPADESLGSLAEVARAHIHRVLGSVGGNKAQAARILGINRATLYRFLKEADPKMDLTD